MRQGKLVQIGAALAIVALVATACASSSTVSAGASGDASSPTTQGSSDRYGSKVGSGYGSGGGSDDGSGGGSGGGSSGSTTVDVAGETTFDLEADNDAGDYFFDPSALKGSAGQTLTLHVANAGSVPHTFLIDDQHINVTLQPGDAQDVKVTFPDSGSVTFYCQIHQSFGMEGSLTVA